MKNNLICLTATLAICVGAFAQDGPSSDTGPKILMYQTNTAGPSGPIAGGGMFCINKTQVI